MSEQLAAMIVVPDPCCVARRGDGRQECRPPRRGRGSEASTDLLRCLALNAPKIAMTSRPLVSRESLCVAGDHQANAPTNRAVTRKCAKNDEGRLITGPRLLISGSKVRVLDGPPMITGASRTPEAPADFRSAGLRPRPEKAQEIDEPDRRRGKSVDPAFPHPWARSTDSVKEIPCRWSTSMERYCSALDCSSCHASPLKCVPSA